MKLKYYIKRIPILGSVLIEVNRKLLQSRRKFSGSQEYWIQRYRRGGNSGAGSYDKLANFKASILNNFVCENKIDSVIEFGCGDGNQLKLSDYPLYVGFDISPDAIRQCKHIFRKDPSKTFMLIDNYAGETAELTLSLDVVYHLVEDHVFDEYMQRLFDSSRDFVIVYSSNTDNNSSVTTPHVRHRKFIDWVKNNRSNWRLLQHIPNRYPLTKSDASGSFADFYIFKKSENPICR
jgi:SAM-dependent methyltransferase